MVMRHLEIGPIIFVPDVFEHAKRNNVVERSFSSPIVLQAKINGQPLAQFFPQHDLLLGDRDAGDVRLVSLGREFGEASPSASDVEYLLPGLYIQFAAHEIELRFLGLIERACVSPIAARIRHTPIKHPLKKIVPDIIMPFADLKCPRSRSGVRKKRSKRDEKISGRETNLCYEIARKDLHDKLIECGAIPPTSHIGLPKSERPATNDGAVQSPIVDRDVPRPTSVYLHIHFRQ